MDAGEASWSLSRSIRLLQVLHVQQTAAQVGSDWRRSRGDAKVYAAPGDPFFQQQHYQLMREHMERRAKDAARKRAERAKKKSMRIDAAADSLVGDRPPMGDRPMGDCPVGDRPVGDRPLGDRPMGDRPMGDRPMGDRPMGDRPASPSLFFPPPSPSPVPSLPVALPLVSTDATEQHHSITASQLLQQLSPRFSPPPVHPPSLSDFLPLPSTDPSPTYDYPAAAASPSAAVAAAAAASSSRPSVASPPVRSPSPKRTRMAAGPGVRASGLFRKPISLQLVSQRAAAAAASSRIAAVATHEVRLNDDEDDDQEQEQKGEDRGAPTASPVPASATPPPFFDAEWEKVVRDRVEQLLSPGFLRNKRLTIANKRRTVERNVRAHIKQSLELGCVGPHHCASGCPGPFQPRAFYTRTQFAHYADRTVKAQQIINGSPRQI